MLLFYVLLFLLFILFIYVFRSFPFFIAIFLRNVHQFFFRVRVFLWGWTWWRWGLYLYTISVWKVFVKQVLSIFAASAISDLHRQPKLQVKCANLTNILLLAARLAYTSSFVYASVSLPLKYSEWSKAYSALLPKILFQHSDIRILSITFFAGNWEIRFFPALFVDARFNGHASLTSFHFDSLL